MAKKAPTPAKKAAPKKASSAKSSKAAPTKKLTKTEFIKQLMEKMTAQGVSTDKKSAQAILDVLTEIIREQITDGPGEVTLPGLMKVRRAYQDAKPEREGPVPGSPGETRLYPPKAAEYKVKVTTLKGLKDMVVPLNAKLK